MKVAEYLFREASTNVTDCFVGLGFGVVAGQKESTIHRCTFAFAVVGAENDKVEGVSDACKVIFFDLKFF